MPALLLQKPSESSKVKRCIKLWGKELLSEGKNIQQRLRSGKEGITIAIISLRFNNLMSKGNFNSLNAKVAIIPKLVN